MSSDLSLRPVLDSHFSTQIPNQKLTLLLALKDRYPQSQHVAISGVVDVNPFPLSSYLTSVNLEAEVIDDPGTQKIFEWDDQKKLLYADIITGSFKFTYEGTEYLVYKISWVVKGSTYYFYDIIFKAENDEAGQKLAGDVYEWANALKKELWVYQNGRWKKSKSLYKSIEATTWDQIVLDQSFKEGLRRDTETFFSSKDVYDSLGITWKRGILLLGPPGNGKTESIKALLHETQHSVLYVKSISTPWGPEYGVRSVFEHARKNSPCILVLEDLDSMLVEKAKSFFLNELDGLAQNDGILTIASTNHPEDIDDAIINRPSRFDTKYTYALPSPELRKEFAVKWLRKIGAMGARSGVVFEKSEDELAQGIADQTDGWSFAFLKELFISFLLRMAHEKSLALKLETEIKPADETLFSQVEALSKQIIKLTAEEEEEKKKKRLKADGEENWCPPAADDSAFVHSGANF